MSERSSSADRRIAPRLALARAAILWEQAWPACWPAVFVLAILAVLTLFGVLTLLPGLLHAAILLALGAAFIIALGTGLHRVVMPDADAARRRIERSSGLRHRPLAALADRPSAPLDVAAAQLWEAYQRRMASAARGLRIGFPAAGLAAGDPWGLRAVLAILLLLGAVDAGADWPQRIASTFYPNLPGEPVPTPTSLQIWVSPPDYTGLPPEFLRPAATGTIEVPTGSRLIAQIHGGRSLPHLMIDGNNRVFTAADKENFQISATLKAGKRLSVTQAGVTLGSWPIAIIPDRPPTIAFVKPPGATAQKALRIDYRAADDYGVEAVEAEIARVGGKRGEKLTIALPLPGLRLKEAKATSYDDLTAHPWAGLPVEIRLIAKDAKGQSGLSAPVRLTLPARVFHNPVARAIVAQRRQLVLDPGSRLAVAEILGDLQSYTRLYRNDVVVFLGLRIAAGELRQTGAVQALPRTESLLWDLALRIEDGGVAISQRELRRLERQLQDALARNAPEHEIERLSRQLRQALDRYLQQLAQSAPRTPRNAPPPSNQARTLTRRDLDRMLERAMELAHNGARAEARQLLAQLQNMLENLRVGRASRQAMGEARQTMQAMQQLMRQQQNLLDRSFQAQQQMRGGMQGQFGRPPFGQPQPGRGQGRAMGNAAGDQEALRRQLGRVMRRLSEQLGSIPDPLGQAERAMNNAAGALREGYPGQAIGPQTEALDQLQQAAREVAREMARRLGRNLGLGSRQLGVNGSTPDRDVRRDPFGRPLAGNGAFDAGTVKIPDANAIDTARKILDELRRRAGERSRPEIERDYIDRLLNQF